MLGFHYFLLAGTLAFNAPKPHFLIKKARTDTLQKAVELIFSPDKTTMVANGKDVAKLRVSAFDAQSNTVVSSAIAFKIKVTGDALVLGLTKAGNKTWQAKLERGTALVQLRSGHKAGKIDVEISAEGLYPGKTTIISIHVARPDPSLLTSFVIPAYKRKSLSTFMKGADISYLPELEAKGIKFSDKGVAGDAIQILKSHGFNYIRLRIFVDPSTAKGYSPRQGFCDLEHTLKMARRIKAAKMNFLLDFHYSDYWADPQQQNKPAAWTDLTYPEMQKALYTYTKSVLNQLKQQNTVPDMVQVGNEVNHGIDWEEGQIGHMDSLAGLLRAGIYAVHETLPSSIIMLHIALGGQNKESHFFLDNMIARKVDFDVVGESYYPKWHGSITDLQTNLSDLAQHYNVPVIVVEYSQKKKEVYAAERTLPRGKGMGVCIWEPLNTWESVFNKDGSSNDKLALYDTLNKN